MNKDLSVTKSNELIQASYRLTLQEQRVILACLAKVDPRHDIPKTMKLSASEFADFSGVDMKNAYDVLIASADKLFERSIEFLDDDKKTKFRWVQKQVTTTKGEGEIEIEWSTEILKYISQLNSQFTTYKLKHVRGLQSTYSIRLYELLMQWNSTGKRVIDIDELRDIFDVKDKYPLFKGFNQHIISKAVKELNVQSDLIIKYETVKRGKTVQSIRFNFKIDDQMKMDL